MKYEVLKLKDYFPQIPQTTDFEATLSVYCQDNSEEIEAKRKHPAVLICPGGGYAFTSDREAEPVALSFLPHGINAFVLRYSCAPERYPVALLQAAAAMTLIRRKAEEYGVDPEKTAVLGFSAGGHLACSLGELWGEPFVTETLGLRDRREDRPNAMVLCYPVISSGALAHRGSFDVLLGENPGTELLEKVSLEKQVSTDTPPAFIWSTFDDQAVPTENSLLLAAALRKNNIPFELHIYPKGVHGLSLCGPQTAGAPELINPHCGTWFNLCLEWLEQTLGF